MLEVILENILFFISFLCENVLRVKSRVTMATNPFSISVNFASTESFFKIKKSKMVNAIRVNDVI